MRYAKRFIRIPQKVVNNYRQKNTENNYTQEKTVDTDDYLFLYLLGVGVVLNVGLFFKMRENHREDKLKNEINNEIYKKYKL